MWADARLAQGGLGRRTSVADQGGQYSNWAYGCTGQLGGDLYFTSSGGWATLTLSQWTLFIEADWETLPVEGAGGPDAVQASESLQRQEGAPSGRFADPIDRHCSRKTARPDEAG
ncbi:MAG: hypothetical protein WBC44_19525 [Planctomycetaceae bacterium]